MFKNVSYERQVTVPFYYITVNETILKIFIVVSGHHIYMISN